MNEIEIIRHGKIKGLTLFINTVSFRVIHEHPEWELIWVLETPLVVSFHADQHVIQPGEMLLICPHELHALRKHEGSSTFLCLQIAPGILPISSHHLLLERFPYRIMSQADFDALKQQMYSIACKYFGSSENDALYCLGQSILVLHRLLSLLPIRELTSAEVSNIRKRNARIQRLLRFVEENYMHKIRLSDFAEKEGCCLNHLSRLIKEQTQQTFQEHVTYVRFINACRMIDSGSTKMLDVCNETGFSDYRYFTKAFRQYLNITPEEYARSFCRASFCLPEPHGCGRTSEEIHSSASSLAFIRSLAEKGILPKENGEN